MLNTPVSTEPVVAVTYDILWLSEFHCDARNTDNVVITAKISPARVVDGKYEACQCNEMATLVRIDNFFANATPDELAAMGTVIQLLKTRAGI